MRGLFLHFFLCFVLVVIASSCDKGGGGTSNVVVQSAASADNSVTVTGQLAIEDLEGIEVEDVLLGGREIEISDSEGKKIAKTTTENDGTYITTIPGALVIAEAKTETDTVALADSTSFSIRSIITDASSEDVVGLDETADLSKGGLIELGAQNLKKITAIRGRAFLDGARDHTGIAVYVPGTSLQARTDSSGMFVMPFIEADTYSLRFEKDGYEARDVASVVVEADKTTAVEALILKLSGGTSTFSVKQIGDEGLSASRTVEYLITAGDADRFKAGLSADIAQVAYDKVPELYTHEFSEDGTYELSFVFANADGFESTLTRTVIVDTEAPDATGLHLADRNSLSVTHSNELYVIALHEDCSDIDKVAVVAGGDQEMPSADSFVWNCYSSASDSNANFQLPEDAGTYTYTVWVRDIVGNYSASGLSSSIILDTTAPAPLSLTLADQTSVSTSGTDITTVFASIAACTDTAKVMISESQLLPPTAAQFVDNCSATANAYTYTFANNIAGTKTVLIWALDAAGNVGQVSGSANIVLDQTALDTPPTFTLADPTPANSDYTNERDIEVLLANCTDVAKVLLSESQVTKPNEDDAGWQDCSLSAIEYSLVGAEGLRSVHLWTKDIGGIVSNNKRTATITLDITMPEIGDFTIAMEDSSGGSETATNALTIDISLSPCNEDSTMVYIGEAATAPEQDDFVTECGDLDAYTLGSSAEGSHSLYVWVMDIAGNVSATSYDTSIIYDSIAPGLPATFSVADDDFGSTAFTNTTTLDYSIASCTGVDYIFVKESQNTAPGENDAGWLSCATTGNINNLIAASAGTHTVYLWTKDEAGNVSASSRSHAIDWDVTAPDEPNSLVPSGDWSTHYSQTTPSTISGTAEASSTLIITNTTGSLTYTTAIDGDGDWSYALPLSSNAQITLTLAARDAAGNVGSTSTIYARHDNIAPTISDVEVVLENDAATIYFATNESATYVLDYGIGAYTHQATGGPSTSHTATLSGLTDSASGSEYQYRIKVTDLAANQDDDENYLSTFKTYIDKSGAINSETWDSTSTCYFISDNLTVNAGETLTLDPGVCVKVAAQKYIIVQGKLDARGDSGNRISISGNDRDGNAGFWNGLTIQSGAEALDFTGETYNDGSILEYVDFSGAGYAGPSIAVDTAGLALLNTNIQYTGQNSTATVIDVVGGATLNLWDSDVSYLTGLLFYASGGGTRSGYLSLKRNYFHHLSAGVVKYSGSHASGTVSIIDNLFDEVICENLIWVSGSINVNVELTLVGNDMFDVNSSGTIIVTFNANLVAFDFNIVNAANSWALTFDDITDATFTSNIIVGASLPASIYGDVAFSKNQFISSSTHDDATSSVIHNETVGITMSFQNNLFYSNYAAGSKGILAFRDTQSVNVNGNNFINQASNNFYSNIQLAARPDIDATGNYHDGITDLPAIGARTYDQNDVITLGEVDFSSPLATPNTVAPSSPPQNVSASFVSTGTVEIEWSENPETDLDGYIVYYSTDDDYPYDGTGATQGNSGAIIITDEEATSTTISGLTGGLTYYFRVTAYDTNRDGTNDQRDGNESWYSSAASVYVSN